MSKHNLIHLFPEIDCASHPSPCPPAAPFGEPQSIRKDVSRDDGVIRAGLLYMAADLAEMAKIAPTRRARELQAISQLMRALAAS